jgi:hypothetical protein
VFGFVLFLALFLLGLFTFQRAVQSGMEDFLYARGINRIRHFYVEVAPQLNDYFILSTNDDAQGVLLDMGVGAASWWQPFRSTAGMVAMVNSVLGAVSAGLLVNVLGAHSLALATGVSLAVFVLSVIVHQRAQFASFDRANRHQHALFPSAPPRP